MGVSVYIFNKKVKFLKIYVYGATFMKLGGLSGDWKEGMTPDRKNEIDSFWYW